MYARRLQCRNKKWNFLYQEIKNYVHSPCRAHPFSQSPSYSFVRSYLLNSFSSRSFSYGNRPTRLYGRLGSSFRSFSSDGDGNDKFSPIKDANSEKGKNINGKVVEVANNCDAHARLGEEEQKEWLNNEKLAIESKKKESPFLTRREKFKHEFLRRIVPWEKLTVSWETFPYHLHEHTKKLLVECASSHLKHNKFTSAYGSRLNSSSGRILLQSIPGTELYRERLVRALARDLKVPLLVLDSSVLAPYRVMGDSESSSESPKAENPEPEPEPAPAEKSEQQLKKDGSDEEVEPIDSWEEEDDIEPEIGDGADGGGIALQNCLWGEHVLSIAREILLELDDDIQLYAFKTSPRGYIYVRLDKLSHEYGCPSMEEIECYSRKYKQKLDEVGASGEIPDDLALEVSSPSSERLLRVPDDLHRFKEMPMRVSYVDDMESKCQEKDGVFLLDVINTDMGTCTWRLANVKENRDPLAKGRPMSRKQKDWRLELPFTMSKRVTLYLDY